MNANKAVELGFADDILADEKRSADSSEAYLFSGKETETRLMNKLMTHFKPEPKNMTPAKAAEIPAKREIKEPETNGTKVDELEKRLNLIKP